MKLEILEIDNVENTWNNFEKIVCEIVKDILERKVRNTATNISEKLFFESRRHEMEAMDKNTKDMDDTTRWQDITIWFQISHTTRYYIGMLID